MAALRARARTVTSATMGLAFLLAPTMMPARKVPSAKMMASAKSLEGVSPAAIAQTLGLTATWTPRRVCRVAPTTTTAQDCRCARTTRVAQDHAMATISVLLARSAIWLRAPVLNRLDLIAICAMLRQKISAAGSRISASGSRMRMATPLATFVGSRAILWISTLALSDTVVRRSRMRTCRPWAMSVSDHVTETLCDFKPRVPTH